MTTSGTATWNIDVLDLVEEAYERAGLSARTGNDFRTARRSLNIIATEWANRGLNLWTVEQGTQLVTANIATYTLPADTIDLVDAAIRTTSNSVNTDYMITRISFTDYSALVNKTQGGRPLQYFVERKIVPTVTVWPVPTTSDYTLVYWRMRRIQDTTTGTDYMDMPLRFVPALCAALAFKIAQKRPEAAGRLDMLKADYDEQFQMAADEDRDRSSSFFVPWLG